MIAFDTLGRKYIKRTAMERIEAKSEHQGDCIVFIGAVNKKGYGTIKYNNSVWLVHRLVWELTNGYTNLLILHTCDNPPCWNIEHLYKGDDAMNAMDRESRGRGNHAKGETNGCTKLTEQQVLEIRRDYIPWVVTFSKLATKYNVSTAVIRDILNGTAWRHLC